MTEADWLACDDPARMLDALRQLASDRDPAGVPRYEASRVTDRKLRLFGCACCRLAGIAAETVDRLEGSSPIGWSGGWLVPGFHEKTVPLAVRAAILRDIVGNPFRPVRLPKCVRCGGSGRAVYHSHSAPGHQRSACRDCGGSGADHDCPWLTDRVRKLAQAVYDDRAFGRLPVLADELETAGCDNADLIGHLRSEVDCNACLVLVTSSADPKDNGPKRGWVMNEIVDSSGFRTRLPTPCPRCKGKGRLPATHVRGCWALDLLIGKE